MRNAIIWSQPNCSYCKMAKQYLLAKGYTYIEKMIGENYTKKDLLEAVPTAKTVPQIFIDGEYIGGYQELIKKI